MIGAGTITQAILIGQQHDLLVSSGLFLAILTVSFLTVALFYVLRRHIREKFEPVFDRYVNILARINGLVVGAISIGMILDGSVMLLERKGLIP